MSSTRVIGIADLPQIVPARHYNLLSRRVTEHAGAKALKLSQVSMDPAGRADPHVHDREEQMFIVVRGEMGLRIEGQEFRLKPGDAALIRPGERHENFNVFPGTTEYLVISAPVETIP